MSEPRNSISVRPLPRLQEYKTLIKKGI